MSKVTVRPATPADFAAMGIDKIYWRSRAMAGEIDGKVIGVGGFAYLQCGTVAAFGAFTDEARKAKVALHKAGLRLMQQVRDAKLKRVVALADCNIEAAERWLRRLGFRPVISHGGMTAWLWTDG